MATHTTSPTTSHNPTSLVTWLIGTVVMLVGALLIGGYWMQAQHADQQRERQQADVYQNYLNNTRSVPTQASSVLQADQTQAQATRKYLLNHPAVTPGTAFDKPGVQATGKAIAQAIDQAKGL